MAFSPRNNLISLVQGDEHNPHALLGLHKEINGKKCIRLLRPGAHTVYLELFGQIVNAKKSETQDVFECEVPGHATALDYRVYHQSGLLANDPYAFFPSITDFDQYLFNKGVHYKLYHVMGAHRIVHAGVEGVRFAVWAPSARRVSLVADFNHWDGRVNPMRSLGASGIWELFIPGLSDCVRYKFEIKAQSGEVFLKSDPYAFQTEQRPATASIVALTNTFSWEDHHWMQTRQKKAADAAPMIIYEMHLGSWKKDHGHFFNYRKLAEDLAAYCKEMGFTHVELLPIQEHPLDESWGYQVSGFFAPSSRHGTPEDFRWFVNHLHKNEIGVILDWVPGHFVTDSFSLGKFDGSALYEHADQRQGLHPHWNTYIFNFGRKEVSNFLIANALYWLDCMHIDGLRVDAVASMLYLDYGREAGEWIPNQYGGNHNLEAIEFLKHLNSVVHEKFPGVLMIAEESTAFAGISHPLEQGGLGFDMKWNMGWMNDTLRYFSKDMLFRHYHHHDLTFGLLYAFTEKFVLALSHDEVVHGKNSLLGKMPGDLWQQLANLRLLYSYMICQPGKKLLFMGGEIGQWNEWNCKGEIEWLLLNFPTHNGLKTMVKEINHLYLQNSILWEHDFDPIGFQWVDFHDQKNSVISYLRIGSKGKFLCVHNFTAVYHEHYHLHLGNICSVKEEFNSDDVRYGGSGQRNHHIKITKDSNEIPIGLEFKLAPLSTMIFNLEFYGTGHRL